MRILIIDDERLLLNSLARLLGRKHEVVTAESAEEGLSHVAEADFDAILCDRHLEGMSGDRFVAILDPFTAARVILMTALLRTDEDRVRAPTIEKPFSTDELFAVIDTMGETAGGSVLPFRAARAAHLKT